MEALWNPVSNRVMAGGPKLEASVFSCSQASDRAYEKPRERKTGRSVEIASSRTSLQ